jgi:hypothetical protein
MINWQCISTSVFAAEVLINDEHAKIAIPTNTVIQQYKQLMKSKYPALEQL